jgi:hypothetical protein
MCVSEDKASTECIASGNDTIQNLEKKLQWQRVVSNTAESNRMQIATREMGSLDW